MKRWIAEIRGRYVKTVLIPAGSRSEAELKLRAHARDIEDVSVEMTQTGIGRVIREDKETECQQ